MATFSTKPKQLTAQEIEALVKEGKKIEVFEYPIGEAEETVSFWVKHPTVDDQERIMSHAQEKGQMQGNYLAINLLVLAGNVELLNDDVPLFNGLCLDINQELMQPKKRILRTSGKKQ
jgi:hypothetical protein